MEVEEHKVNIETPDKTEVKQQMMMMLIENGQLETTQLPHKSPIKCRIHEAIKYRMKLI